MHHTMPEIRERLESLPCMSAPERTGELHSANAIYTFKNLIFYYNIKDVTPQMLSIFALHESVAFYDVY